MFGFLKNWSASFANMPFPHSFSVESSVKVRVRRGLVKAWHGDRDAANTSIFTIQTRWMEKASLLPKIVTACAWVQLVLYKQHMNYCLFFCSFFVLIYSYFLFLERIIHPLETCNHADFDIGHTSAAFQKYLSVQTEGYIPELSRVELLIDIRGKLFFRWKS